MADPQNILVVTGSRALARTAAARVWALRELAARIYSGTVDVVAHGACRNSPDDWADNLAKNFGVDTSIGVVRWHMKRDASDPPGPYKVVDGNFVLIRGAELYPYATTLERNSAMARWAGDMLKIGLGVTGLALRCEWPLRDGERKTEGAAHCRDALFRALGADRVEDLVCPRHLGPQEARRG